jgi:hypothetical protein
LLLEGAMTILCDGQMFEARTGSFIWLPRGRPAHVPGRR